MNGFSAFLVLCLIPAAIFVAGWLACWFMAVRYRVRLEKRE
jgi:hypothetical protein